jgi:hypothetical protein
MSDLRRGTLAVVAAAGLVLGAPLDGHAPKTVMAHVARLAAKAARPRRGRPRKFTRPSRAVTLTLPHDVIEALRAVDPDLSRAVVRAVEHGSPATPSLATELVTYGNRQVIVVPRSLALAVRADVELIPLSDGRALIAFDERLSVPQLELKLGDALTDPALTGEDRSIFEALTGILSGARRDATASVQQRSIIVLQRAKRGAPNGAGPRTASPTEPQQS